MNKNMIEFLLLAVPVLPLLLAFPALRSFLSRPCLIALLPGIIIVAIPDSVTVEIPWLLLGTTLAIDETSRLLLAVSVLLWTLSGTFLHTSRDYPSDGRRTTCLMLTLAGNLGVILAADLISFFLFLTLMSYGFYALLISGGEETRQSGRLYLSIMILADLVLFEALLIAGTMTDDLGFSAVHHTIAESSYLDLYLVMVLIGFAARAGIWPLHFWLLPVYRSSISEVAVLLGGVPVAIGLLGMVRWLPLGEIISPQLGLMLQIMGIMAILYAIFFGLIRAQMNSLPVYAAIIASGFYVIALGSALVDPAAWSNYGYWVYFFIAAFTIGFAMLVMVSRWLESKHGYCTIAVKQPDYLKCWLKVQRSVGIERLMLQMKTDRVYLWCTNVDFSWWKRSWKKRLDDSEYYLQRWSVAITLFILLGIVVAIIGGLSI
ncbi:MAG: formate hydrogenlyase [gamma proteobacterium symbiont of Bathyaustriella thionipta]|nr:formate hydrogenlyase [gamma proteobacterium symbiont of Bathyaustriella thionipta]MCU7948845.1 formate hydrogenlyase [gamma proteobacterium symbiont of Bathyaustriella thionipta]MCU7954344.1 formate hydrogenlyase [gamma proteobacterium symbiont of Bathyaustriella thionipta]MCU7955303.1 formate hydrogenlyase [gamma proteobacterium symbiont of Bathyaustriella thionipta]MCU7967132.1 formate hydrogenlyase [gamma proteobacterium symbiont of Bathyaustriella thionipta]